ncbi:hypothetical protein Tco_0313690 [Tanacetum coccineum]
MLLDCREKNLGRYWETLSLNALNCHFKARKRSSIASAPYSNSSAFRFKASAAVAIHHAVTIRQLDVPIPQPVTLTDDRAIFVIVRMSSFPVHTGGIESLSWLNRDVNLHVDIATPNNDHGLKCLTWSSNNDHGLPEPGCRMLTFDDLGILVKIGAFDAMDESKVHVVKGVKDQMSLTQLSLSQQLQQETMRVIVENDPLDGKGFLRNLAKDVMVSLDKAKRSFKRFENPPIFHPEEDVFILGSDSTKELKKLKSSNMMYL